MVSLRLDLHAYDVTEITEIRKQTVQDEMVLQNRKNCETRKRKIVK
jgi:hypothetical protein